MKKILSIIVITTLFLSPFLTLAAGGSTEVQAGVNYIKPKTQNYWTTMALASAGESNISLDHLKATPTAASWENVYVKYAGTILGITSVRGNPSTFPNEDLLKKLKDSYTSAQIDKTTDINDDIWGILALRSAHIPESDPIIQGAKTFIISNQNADGGLKTNVGAPDCNNKSNTSNFFSDTNNTAAAIAALVEGGVLKSDTAVQKAKDYLKAAQNNDGGFGFYYPNSPWSNTCAPDTASDSDSTSWVVWAISKLGEDPSSWVKNGKTPVDFLKSMQAASGYFKSSAAFPDESAFSVTTTAVAVIALSGKTIPINRMNRAPQVNIDAPSNNASWQAGEKITFRGAATDPDGDMIASYVWDFGKDSGVPQMTTPFPGGIDFDKAGTYTVTFKAKDSLELESQASAITVTVNPVLGTAVIFGGGGEGSSAPLSTSAPITTEQGQVLGEKQVKEEKQEKEVKEGKIESEKPPLTVGDLISLAKIEEGVQRGDIGGRGFDFKMGNLLMGPDKRVYKLGRSNTIHWITNEKVFKALGYKFQDVTPLNFDPTSSYKRGQNIRDARWHSDGDLIKVKGDPRVYLLEAGKARWIRDTEGLRRERIITVSRKEFTSYEKCSSDL
jgi:hypothetical protein